MLTDKDILKSTSLAQATKKGYLDKIKDTQPLTGEQQGWYKIALPGLAGNDLTEDEYAAGKRIFIENMPYVKSRREAMELAGDVMASLGRREDADSPYKTMEFYPDEWGKITRTPDGRYVDDKGNEVVQKLPFYPDRYEPQATSAPDSKDGIKAADSIAGEKYFGSSLNLAGKSATDRELVNKSSQEFDATAGNVVNLNAPAGTGSGSGTGSTGGVTVTAGTAKPEEIKGSNQHKELGDFDELCKELNIKPNKNLQEADAIVISGNIGIDLNKYAQKIGLKLPFNTSLEGGILIDLKSKKVYPLNAGNAGLSTDKIGFKSPLGGKVTMLKIVPDMDSGFDTEKLDKNREKILTGQASGGDIYFVAGCSVSRPKDPEYKKISLVEVGFGTPAAGWSWSDVMKKITPDPANKEQMDDAFDKLGSPQSIKDKVNK